MPSPASVSISGSLQWSTVGSPIALLFLGTNEPKITKILTMRTNEQRRAIAAAYKKKYKKVGLRVESGSGGFAWPQHLTRSNFCPVWVDF